MDSDTRRRSIHNVISHFYVAPDPFSGAERDPLYVGDVFSTSDVANVLISIMALPENSNHDAILSVLRGSALGCSDDRYSTISEARGVELADELLEYFTPEPENGYCGCGAPGRDPHTCPYDTEMGGSGEYECNCCSECEGNCAMDV